MKSLYTILQEDLSPPLGYPGGPCHVLNRIEKSKLAPKDKDVLGGAVEDGEDLTNQQASKVYQLDSEKLLPGTPFGLKELVISSHAAYRMDLRRVTVPMVRAAIASFAMQWSKYRSQKHPTGQRWEDAMAYNEPIEYIDPKLGIVIVFTIANKVVKLVTTYFKGESDEDIPKDGCQIAAKTWSDEADKVEQDE